jgi:prepilin-type N-terminal cleavage/methylation domain-containing protein
MLNIGRGHSIWKTGFTLLEVIVAMTIAAALLAVGRAMLGELGDETLRLQQSAAAADHEANVDATIRVIIGSIDIESQRQTIFAGNANEVTFLTWCDVPDNWSERCSVTIKFASNGDRVALLCVPSIGASMILRSNVRTGELRYLGSADHGGVWTSTWGPGATVPLAIEIVVDKDTLIVPIGDRG